MRPINKLITLALFFCFACGGESPEPGDCTEAYCPFVGDWHLNELYGDGDPVSEDFSAYRLNLKQPQSGSEDGAYQRTFSSGESEEGSWTVTNNDDVLELETPDGTETYIVESVDASSLVLIIERESIKPGPNEFRMVFGK